MSSGRLVQRLGSPGSVGETAFSPNWRFVLTIPAQDAPTAIAMVDVRTGRTVRTLRGDQWLNSPSFSPDGKLVLALSGEPKWDEPGRALVWNASSGRRLFSLVAGGGRVENAEFSPGGTRIVTGNLDGTADIWSTKTGRSTLTLPAVTKNPDWPILADAHFSPDGKLVVVFSVSPLEGADYPVRFFDARSGRLVRTLNGISDAVFSPDSKLLATTGGDGKVRIRDARSGRVLHTLHASDGTVYPVFSPDGSRLLTLGGEKPNYEYSTVRVWDVARGRVLHTLRAPVTSTGFSPDGRLISVACTSCARKSLQIWDAATGGKLRSLDL